MLGALGLGATEVSVAFVGPRVPRALDGKTTSKRSAHGKLRFTYLRGLWHEAATRLPAADSPDLALAFNSGLADYAASWLPTLRHLYWECGVPIAFTSYHKPEAELDVRTLAVRLGVRASHLHCEANPYASALPHLDELFPGRTYTANAFLNVALPEFRLRKMCCNDSASERLLGRKKQQTLREGTR